MANRLGANPVYFDQFDTDTVLAPRGACVTKIRWKGSTDGDDLLLEDLNGNVIFEDQLLANGDWREIDFPWGQKFTEGIQIDVSDCGGDATDGTDQLYIYLK
ncbi:hypothetical protein LCGC14_2573420 [marine sediment metagenome]|uniref:Uncharacterized protein n=1 Tax=marine sediment metagenome TaxID=412755 RepID=A0A0F9B4G6_9ZZZZ